MAARPEKTPKAGLFSRIQDENFERVARREIERMATSDWAAMLGFWGMLPRALPSTRLRLLLHCLQVCTDRSQAPPPQLVKYLRREIEKPPRGRVQNPERMKAAAHYLANHPKCSLAEIAVEIGLGAANKTTIRDYMRQPEFWRECNDHLVRSGQEGGTEGELRRRLVQTKSE